MKSLFKRVSALSKSLLISVFLLFFTAFLFILSEHVDAKIVTVKRSLNGGLAQLSLKHPDKAYVDSTFDVVGTITYDEHEVIKNKNYKEFIKDFPNPKKATATDYTYVPKRGLGNGEKLIKESKPNFDVYVNKVLIKGGTKRRPRYKASGAVINVDDPDSAWRNEKLSKYSVTYNGKFTCKDAGPGLITLNVSYYLFYQFQNDDYDTMIKFKQYFREEIKGKVECVVQTVPGSYLDLDDEDEWEEEEDWDENGEYNGDGDDKGNDNKTGGEKKDGDKEEPKSFDEELDEDLEGLDDPDDDDDEKDKSAALTETKPMNVVTSGTNWTTNSGSGTSTVSSRPQYPTEPQFSGVSGSGNPRASKIAPLMSGQNIYSRIPSPQPRSSGRSATRSSTTPSASPRRPSLPAPTSSIGTTGTAEPTGITKGGMTERVVGREVINGVEAEKKWVEFTGKDGKRYSGHIWVAKGAVVKYYLTPAGGGKPLTSGGSTVTAPAGKLPGRPDTISQERDKSVGTVFGGGTEPVIIKPPGGKINYLPQGGTGTTQPTPAKQGSGGSSVFSQPAPPGSIIKPG